MVAAPAINLAAKKIIVRLLILQLEFANFAFRKFKQLFADNRCMVIGNYYPLAPVLMPNTSIPRLGRGTFPRDVSIGSL